jgi:hypothetical protein
MSETKHKVFISYHHANDQWYKNELLKLNKLHNIFIDGSVDTGHINPRLDNETIRQIIRNDYLKDTTVTILLVGTETKNRKHIDWELKSSMINGSVNKKSGILVINLPRTGSTYYTATHSGEKEKIYPENTSWTSITTRAEYERRYPYLPARIIDNLLKSEAKISVVNWSEINIEKLRFLIHATFEDKASCEYDLSRTMRIQNA